MNEILDIEVGNLLETVYDRYGYDFRQYAHAHIQRRLLNLQKMSGFKSISEMHRALLTEKHFASLLLQNLSITVTEMFRDPQFFLSLRENVIPYLRTYPFIKIWHAGCATGEEVYSMAIMLQEEGLYERSTIYATDFNPYALQQAREGIVPNAQMRKYTLNYQQAGGRKSFSEYYNSDYDMSILTKSLKKNIVWGHHNLATDSVFTEIHLVICRNVLIYFNQGLQNRAQSLFYDSLIPGGHLCLGSKESLNYSEVKAHYSVLDRKQNIYKKKYFPA